MNLEPLLVFVVVIAVGYFMLRWGSAIFLCYALFYFLTAQWTRAALAIVFSLFVEFVKQMVIALSRLTASITSIRSDPK